MKLLVNIILFLLFEIYIVNFLWGQNDCQQQINAIMVQKNKVSSEKGVAINQLKQGKFCSVCNRSKIEIERAEGINFEQHLKNVNGKEIPASPDVIKQKENEYNQQLKDFDSQILAIRINCNGSNASQNQVTDYSAEQNPNSSIDNTYNPQNFVDNTYNLNGLIDNSFHSNDTSLGKYCPVPKDTLKSLPLDLSDQINKKDPNELVCTLVTTIRLPVDLGVGGYVCANGDLVQCIEVLDILIRPIQYWNGNIKDCEVGIKKYKEGDWIDATITITGIKRKAKEIFDLLPSK